MEEKELNPIQVTTYTADVGCYNCGDHAVVLISKGITIEEYKEGKICPNCGCRIDGGG